MNVSWDMMSREISNQDGLSKKPLAGDGGFATAIGRGSGNTSRSTKSRLDFLLLSLRGFVRFE